MTLPVGRETIPFLIVIFADEDTHIVQIMAVLAHELGHALQYFAIDGGQSIASMFIEGFATWSAGPYWLEWQGDSSFQSAVKSYIAAGTYLPLHDSQFLSTVGEDAVARFGQECLNRRDIAYTTWAAFIEYLVQEYGRERLFSLFRAPPLLSDDEETPIPRPNFPAVYGGSLQQLEAAWLEWLTAND